MATKTKQATPEEQRANLDELLAEVKQDAEESSLSLDALLGQPVPLGDAWPGRRAAYLSPKMKRIRDILLLWHALESTATDTVEGIVQQLDAYGEIARALLRVQDENGGKWRKPTLAEVQESFDLDELKVLIARVLRKDKFLSDEPTDMSDPNA